MHTHTYNITTTFTFICTYVITCKLPCLLLQGMVLWSFCGIPVKLGFSLGFLGILHLHNYNHMKYIWNEKMMMWKEQQRTQQRTKLLLLIKSILLKFAIFCHITPLLCWCSLLIFPLTRRPLNVEWFGSCCRDDHTLWRVQGKSLRGI